MVGADRDIRFDVLKGVLIILVVLGHSINIEYQDASWDNALFHTIYSFHMPLFVFLSGYFLQSSLNRPLLMVAERRFYRLIVPAITFTVINSLVYLFSKEGSSGVTLKTGLVLTQVYWYLICVFVLSIAGHLYHNHSRVFIFVAYIFLLVIELLFPVVSAFDCQVGRMFPCFLFGVIVGGIKEKRENVNAWARYGHLIIPLLVLIADRVLFGFNLTRYHLLIRILDGFCACVLMGSLLFHIIDNCHKKYSFPHLSWVGKRSLAIYLVHLPIYNLFVYNHLFVNHSTLQSLLLFVFIYSCSLLTVWTVEKLVHGRALILFGL